MTTEDDLDGEASVEIEASPEFKRQLKILAKKYLSIRSDVEPIIQQIKKGESVGDQITGTGFLVFKVRVKNSDIQKGKSGGYRFIYYLKTSTKALLVTIYSKSEQSDVSAKRIVEIINECL